MSWGDSFKSAWNSATNAARATVSAIATGAEAVADGAAAAAQFMAREAQDMASAAGHAAVAAGQAIEGAAVAVEQAVVDAAEWAADQTKNAAVGAAHATVAAAKATAKGVATAFNAAKKAFSTAVAGLATACTAVEDWIVGGLFLGGGLVLTKPGISELIRPIVRLWGDDSQKKYDGDVLGGGCQKGNPQGVLPPGCRRKVDPKLPPLPKIIYINGIDTRYTPKDPSQKDIFHEDGICKTMQNIAATTCSEVTGIYNAAEGIGRDLDECLDNIAKNSNSPALVPLTDTIVNAARSGQETTIFAHSQGGLITQEAIARAKEKLVIVDQCTPEEAEQKLSVVKVKSFGTALMGWPKGPDYERFTNTADPVPPVIIGAQTSYPTATWKDSAPATPGQNHVFTDPHFNPIDSHSMDNTYLPAYAAIPKKGQRKGVHCACKGT